MNRFICLIAIMILLWPGQASAMILINEILADPPAGLSGDANNDGVGSTTQDEFIELFNAGEDNVDLSGWYLSDALKTRHTFAAGSILTPQEIVMIFGGGTPQLSGINWQTASSGSLGLNNSGDTVSLFNSTDELVNQVAYGSEAGKDQSIVRSPEGSTADLIQHLSLANAGGLRYSAGYFVNPLTSTEEKEEVVLEDTFPQTQVAAVPEPATLCYVGFGLGMMLTRLRKN